MYEQTATRYLKDQKQIAKDAAHDATERETELFQEMTKDEDDPRKAAMLRMISREIAGSEMTEFLGNL